MAQINVIGYVAQDIILKHSQEGTAYVHFYMKEYIGKSRYQAYQVWAWDNVASMLQRLRIKKGSLIWVSGSLELVDHTAKGGLQTKMLKIYCSDFSIVRCNPAANLPAESMTADSVSAAYDKIISSRYEELKTRYGFRKSGFIIVPPKTSKEIVEEGQALRHCVGTYVKKVALEKSTILFMRKAKEPDKPFCTIEVVGDHVMQARIQQNADPPPKAKAFLSLWKSTVVEAPLAEAA